MQFAAPPAHAASTSSAERLLAEYQIVRGHTERLAAALTPEDQCVQSMPDASPVKWHRGHTTWFFEEFVLGPHAQGYAGFDAACRFLFNSYYDTVGPRQPRPRRGLITRPSAGEVGRYRAHVDQAMAALIGAGEAPGALVLLGLQHEQQHQELLVTDMMHAFAASPLAPAVLPGWREPAGMEGEAGWLDLAGGLATIGHRGGGFRFDNETPSHLALLRPYRLADRCVRNRNWLEFMQDGGYRTPTLWMSDGWEVVQREGWTAPLYWRDNEAGWAQMGPGGLAPLDPRAPVRHVSWYEADAFARWAGARLPTEEEFEHALGLVALHEVTGHVWQWTASPYRPYPGFVPAAGAIGEYNGKFMVNQMVLRGGSFASPPGHARPTYRNFFHPDRRWQVSGLRLARDA
ncbi:Ergothioneine biosynthesis protein EgtB [Rhodovastum atsumiense]|uniref:Ergothioneine biosynthesis protein EgtB n=1 Tax=Rhodovastum atsumiense TaxID=504468 RepID=A0A5M6J084_9PROT|nr:ergothioneine biosynthesis protein EgtB [Rhodovastum atsumiense]KAA5613008.1 ergothioneine biosynthesis protein EgtB [Rhodovastum atsumiense]CAH2600140.1 Ergothioneine biosynthesis protein EgtB [Rhodovastum atsumiense]